MKTRTWPGGPRIWGLRGPFRSLPLDYSDGNQLQVEAAIFDRLVQHQISKHYNTSMNSVLLPKRETPSIIGAILLQSPSYNPSK